MDRVGELKVRFTLVIDMRCTGPAKLTRNFERRRVGVDVDDPQCAAGRPHARPPLGEVSTTLTYST